MSVNVLGNKADFLTAGIIDSASQRRHTSQNKSSLHNGGQNEMLQLMRASQT